jgi:hypothetical protein
MGIGSFGTGPFGATVAGGYYPEKGQEEANKKASSGLRRRRGVWGTRSYLSRPDRVGVSTSISSREETGCCGFIGPNPSATLDKILTKLSKKIVGQWRSKSNGVSDKFSGGSPSTARVAVCLVVAMQFARVLGQNACVPHHGRIAASRSVVTKSSET